MDLRREKCDSEKKDSLKIIEKWWKYDSEQRDNLKVVENDEKMIPNREIS